MKGRLFEIREFTLHDGPGIRTTVFFKGCPLRCAWCQNPEGQSFDVETMTRRDGTRIPCGEDWEAPALAGELLKNADILTASGGGVTFSGGEPLAQAGFLDELIPLLKAGGVSVAIETSGAVDGAVYRRIVSQLDFVYQDLKLPDASSFAKWCGEGFDRVSANVAWLRTSGVRHVFRTPVIPGVNDGEAVRAALRALAGGSPHEFLPSNPAAGAKYPMLGRVFPKELTQS